MPSAFPEQHTTPLEPFFRVNLALRLDQATSMSNMDIDPPAKPEPSESSVSLPQGLPEPPQTALPLRPVPPPEPPAAQMAKMEDGTLPGPSMTPQTRSPALERPTDSQAWPATALPPIGPTTPAPAPSVRSPTVQPSPDADMKPATPVNGGAALEQAEPASPPGSLRPLNVKDALSYLEMVKQKFSDKAEVYNQFLDIMKDFKSQSIDTPGVIGRVSGLFRGHPTLIQGFNTFLPQGYRIDCSTDEQDNSNLITVTTPSGTHTQTSDGVIRSKTRNVSGTPVPTPGVDHVSAYFGPNGGPYAVGGSGPNGPGQGLFNDPAPVTPQPMSLGLPPQQLPRGFSPGPHGIHSPHPSTPGVANFLGGLQHHHHMNASHGQSSGHGDMRKDSKNPVEFNHAINYVNKIKNRYTNDPDTYKQFLEILQTYQKEQRPIQTVYEQVAVLFGGNNDLLDEFKQFLPDTSQPGAMGALEAGVAGGQFDLRVGNSLLGAINAESVPRMGSVSGTSAHMERPRDQKSKDRRGPAPPPPSSTAGGDRMSGVADKLGTGKRTKKRGNEKDVPPPAHQGPSGSRLPPAPSHGHPANGPNKSKKPKHHHKSEPSPPYDRPPTPIHAPVPSAANDEVMFFDRVKKYIDDRSAYNEFLKLLHLFTEEIFDLRTLMERAAGFLGGEGSEMMALFKEVVHWDERAIVDGEMNADGSTALSAVRGTVAVVPTMDRPKVDLNSCRKYGPSYRKLPKHEVTLACSGRDAMCWEVLNDEWVSHPTWASEDAGFSTHKKNLFEDAMHKSEEERHEYDFHIEGITRTITILEPLNTRINLMDADERAAYKLKPGLGGQGKSIYQRIIKKVYGREHGLEVITALHDTPAVAVPVVLNRLKQKEEEWKRAQREWNKVWREVDARNYYKSLDHQGINFKINDKKIINPKQLVQDIETKRREMDVERAKSIDPAYARTIPKYHFSFEISDVGVLQDCVKLVLSFLDRAPPNSSMAADARQIEAFLRSFITMFFGIDEEVFNAVFGGSSSHGTSANGSGHTGANGVGDDFIADSDADDAMAVDDDGSSSAAGTSNGKKRRAGGDLRRKALKGAAASGGKKGAATANGKKSASTSRRASPAPPQLVAGSAMDDAMLFDTDSNEKGKGKMVGPGTRVQDNVWVRHDPQDGDEAVLAADAAQNKPLPGASRKGTFFANNTFYVLLRNLQLLYCRLKAAKHHAENLASTSSPPSDDAQSPNATANGPGQPVPHAYLANPLATSLGLADATGPGASRLITSGPNPAHKFYEHTLECCEQLFDGEMDQATFEDHLRFMFGIRAYHLFTVDKVVGSVIKQVQAVLSDGKNKELLTLLRRERTSATQYTFQEQINARRTAEQIVGLGENVYRLTWLPDRKVMQIQLLAKDDASTDDAESMTERWKQYMASYVLRHQTEGVPPPSTPPFIPRTLLRFKSETSNEDDTAEDDAGESSTPRVTGAQSSSAKPITSNTRASPSDMTPYFKYGSRSGVAIKVCIRTYRMFFESGGEDWFYRKRSAADERVVAMRKDEVEVERTERMKEWLDKRLEELTDGGKSRGRSKASPPGEIAGQPEVETSAQADEAVANGEGEEPPALNGVKDSEDVEMAVSA